VAPATAYFAEVADEVPFLRRKVAAEAGQARAQVVGRVVSAAKGEVGAEAADLFLPRLLEQDFLQLGPGVDADFVHLRSR